MKISIGGNLRRLRLQKGLTQEQLAEMLGLTAQAVSRWENDQAYPDVTYLPGLAMLYETSVDELVGMESLRKEERLYEAVSGVYTLAREGRLDEAIERARGSLRIYPDNSSLLMALGEALARRTDDEAALREAIDVSERVLGKNDITMKARSTTMTNLLFLYMKSGEEGKAAALVKQLPHIWESREMLVPDACGGEEYEEALKTAVRRALVFLCRKIEACPQRRAGDVPEYVQLGVDFGARTDDREMLRRIGEFLEA